MRIFIMTLFLSISLFAGGDILPVDPISKYEKMENTLNNDIVDNCVTTCGKPAILLPYYGEDIPMATITPCFSEASIH